MTLAQPLLYFSSRGNKKTKEILMVIYTILKRYHFNNTTCVLKDTVKSKPPTRCIRYSIHVPPDFEIYYFLLFFLK